MGVFVQTLGFGIAAGLTVIWYTAMFTVLSFLQGTMRVQETAAQLIVGFGALGGLPPVY